MTLPAPTQIPRAQFKGAYTFASLPTTGIKVNDLAYATDKGSMYYWNGTAWTPAIWEIAVCKSADETVNNSTTLQDDDELKFAVGASEVWFFRICWIGNGSTVADIKVTYAAPAGATATFCRDNEFQVTTPFGNTVTVNLNTGTDYPTLHYGFVRNGSNAGTVQFQWAQNVAEVSDTKVKANSYIIARRIK